MKRIILIGHLSLDRIELNKKLYFPVLGGAVAYASVVFRKLNYDVTIVSEIGADFPKNFLEFFESIGVNTDFISQASSHTTSYYLKYYIDGSRKLFLLQRSPTIPLRYLDALSSLLNSNDVVSILPIANEVPLEYFDFFAKQDVSVIALDLQGLLRKGQRGLVKIQRPDKQILNAIRTLVPTILKASYEEAKVFLPNARPTQLATILQEETNAQSLILSLGEKGTLGLYKEKEFTIPLKENTHPKNTTGAGDVLLSSFVGFFAQGFSFEESLKRANEIASSSVMFMDPIEIYENMKI